MPVKASGCEGLGVHLIYTSFGGSFVCLCFRTSHELFTACKLVFHGCFLSLSLGFSVSGHFSATLRVNTGTSFCVDKNKIHMSGTKHINKLLSTSFRASILFQISKGTQKLCGTQRRKSFPFTLISYQTCPQISLCVSISFLRYSIKGMRRI